MAGGGVPRPAFQGAGATGPETAGHLVAPNATDGEFVWAVGTPFSLRRSAARRGWPDGAWEGAVTGGIQGTGTRSASSVNQLAM